MKTLRHRKKLQEHNLIKTNFTKTQICDEVISDTVVHGEHSEQTDFV